MDVRDILDTMIDFSAGGNNSSTEHRQLFLRYLNLACSELYSRTAMINPEAAFVYEIAEGDIEHRTEIDQPVLMVTEVVSIKNRITLQKVSEASGLKNALLDPSGSRYTSFSWRRTDPEDGRGFDLLLYPFVTGQTKRDHLVVTAVRDLEPLYERSSEDDIPFPKAFHHALVDGGLFYVFQEEGGFRDSMKARDAKARWELEKARISAFFANSAP